MPQDLLLTYYGDDLTGSTDAMEALSSRGVPSVLFVREPSAAEFARFADCRAVGLAGTSRSESPAWMDAHLPGAFDWLRRLEAPLCHYKICSTFDSSPETGSIGRALEIGKQVFASDFVPLVVGAPQLGRATAYGNLFARFRGVPYRIDRHPVASRHPVTPMHEADLRRHLAAQTAETVALADLDALGRPAVDTEIDALLAQRPGAVLFDVLDEASQRAVGRQLWRLRERGRFVVGSSGVEYALLGTWAEAGLVPGRADFTPPGPAGRIAVVSGSCSPTTERQIRHAMENGFEGIALDATLMASDDATSVERCLEDAIARASAALQAGRSVVLFTALGAATDVSAALAAMADGRHRIGRRLGRILRALVRREALGRVVIAGGDTSSHGLQALDAFALTLRLPLPRTPGSPLCTLHSAEPDTNGLEIALKGGQIGSDAYFSEIRDGIG